MQILTERRLVNMPKERSNPLVCSSSREGERRVRRESRIKSNEMRRDVNYTEEENKKESPTLPHPPL